MEMVGLRRLQDGVACLSGPVVGWLALHGHGLEQIEVTLFLLHAHLAVQVRHLLVE